MIVIWRWNVWKFLRPEKPVQKEYQSVVCVGVVGCVVCVDRNLVSKIIASGKGNVSATVWEGGCVDDKHYPLRFWVGIDGELQVWGGP
eukprot:353472-Chlamydomonas_euryale.AAC.1